MRGAQCSRAAIRVKKSLLPGPPMSRDRLVPLIIAVALFMENMDATIIATSLPAIAADIGANPLALKLAAQTVQELFGGQIGSFLAVEAPIFGDIRAMLDQQ